MEALIVMLALALLAVPVLLVVSLTSIGALKRRMSDLEDEVARMQAVRPERPEAMRPAGRSDRASSAPESVSGEGASAQDGAEASPARAIAPSAAPMPPLPESPRVQAPPHVPNRFASAVRALVRWFTVGNVIAKVGMLVLLAGVAALLKYASDQGWLTLPIGWRLAGVALAALAGLAFGWRQRTHRRVFALTLQGGAIGVLLLTVFAAFRLYGLMPAVPAFALSVALVAALGVLATLQNAGTLAIFGTLAGFLAPIWLSTGDGSHVALFSYYALLNVGVLAMAWLRAWRMLNLLGFVFTWGIGVLWGVLQYDPDKFASTQPFLLLFFAFYLALPVLYLRRQPGHRYDRIDGSLVFGTPLIAFSLQAALLDGARAPLALCALALALLYALLAWRLLPAMRYRMLGTAHAILAVGFATLAIPLAFSAHATVCLFALEGAALIWLGLRQCRWLPQIAGVGLQLVAGVYLWVGRMLDGLFGSLAEHTICAWLPGTCTGDELMFVNADYLSALLVAVSGFASAWLYRRSGRGAAAGVAYLWGLLWWCGSALAEIDRFVAAAWQPPAWLALLAVSAWLAAEADRRLAARGLMLTVIAGFAGALLQAFGPRPELFGDGAWAWALFALLGVRSLWCLRAGGRQLAAWAQLLWWVVWPVLLTDPGLARQAGLADGWVREATVLPWLAMAAISLFRWPWLRWPLGAGFDACRTPLQGVVFAALALAWLDALFQPGVSAPLPWVPLLNPLEAVQLATLVLAALWLRTPHAPALLTRGARMLPALALLALLSFAMLRTVHHWTDTAWSLKALWPDQIAQACLTVLWSVLGMAAWIAGSRRGDRGLWLAGAVLMGVVLAKLVLVDRQHLGNLAGILSFIAYGVLCMAVGYFAPAPPKAREDVPAR
ncbi:DUF2339 domain-containing protein [Luteimonas salinilitoris]|uniref:DUF2339 domain-containing protein n=1 Tax=Luteimonas salinilitoris TaxID=3237697 RepID=A0ABV4HL96_9GAMM